jgi:chemotaxis protein methyltransferase CheR
MSNAVKIAAPSNSWVLSDEEFKFFRDLILNIAGISLSPAKKELVRSRLRSQIQALDLNSFKDYKKYLENLPPDSPHWQIFTNLLTTNKTDFFREPKHFDYIKESLIPYWKSIGLSSVNIWSCASSTGEEPYSLAMVLQKNLPPTMDFKILATDIDTDVLKHCKNGVYSESKLIEIPSEYQEDYISRGTGEVEGWFKVKSDLKKKIIFCQHNLVSNTRPSDYKFDLIVCRNVMIYFSKETIEKINHKLYDNCKNGGTLFIGHSETLYGDKPWETMQPAIFQKRNFK